MARTIKVRDFLDCFCYKVNLLNNIVVRMLITSGWGGVALSVARELPLSILSAAYLLATSVAVSVFECVLWFDLSQIIDLKYSTVRFRLKI